MKESKHSELITSVQNPLIKDTARLHQKKARAESGLLLVETRHPIEEAIAAGLAIENFFVLENAAPDQLPKKIHAKPISVSQAVMEKLSTTDSAPPCLAVFKQQILEVQQANETKVFSGTEKALVLILDTLQDPGNLGTLIRSAVAFGVSAIITTQNTVDAYSPKVIRASAGLVFRIPVLDNTALAALADTGWPVFWATHEANAVSYKNVNFNQPCALVLGSEGTGITEALKQQLNLTPITVPMTDAADSLNVAISGSVILADVFQQRKQS